MDGLATLKQFFQGLQVGLVLADQGAAGKRLAIIGEFPDRITRDDRRELRAAFDGFEGVDRTRRGASGCILEFKAICRIPGRDGRMGFRYRAEKLDLMAIEIGRASCRERV